MYGFAMKFSLILLQPFFWGQKIKSAVQTALTAHWDLSLKIFQILLPPLINFDDLLQPHILSDNYHQSVGKKI